MKTINQELIKLYGRNDQKNRRVIDNYDRIWNGDDYTKPKVPLMTIRDILNRKGNVLVGKDGIIWEFAEINICFTTSHDILSEEACDFLPALWFNNTPDYYHLIDRWIPLIK